MAYMRGNPYIYPRDIQDVSGVQIETNTGSIFLRDEVMQDLAVMVLSRLSDDELADVVRRVAANYGGNIGADGVMERLGLPSVMDQVKAALGEEA